MGIICGVVITILDFISSLTTSIPTMTLFATLGAFVGKLIQVKINR